MEQIHIEKKWRHYFEKLVIIIILILTMLLTACQKKEIEDYFSSVCEIKAVEEGKSDSLSTGFIYNNHVVTVAHGLIYKNGLEYLLYNNIYAKFYPQAEFIKLELVSYDRVKDIAILKFENIKAYQSVKYLDFNKTKIGDDIFTIGNSNGYGLAYNKGNISTKAKKIEYNKEFNYFFQTSIEITKGSSGGPVFSSKGKFIGMMCFKLRDSNLEYIDGMSFAIPSNIINDYLN